MSSGALPKSKSSKSSVHQHASQSNMDDIVTLPNTNSEFSFELKPKPKLTCIPENSCSKFFSNLRKTQSMNVAQKVEAPEKTWSVLFIGSKSNIPPKGFFM